MEKTQSELYYLTYDQLRGNKDIPKSFFGFWWWLLHQMGRALRQGFPKRLLTTLIYMLSIFIINSVFLIFINESMYLSQCVDSRSILAYIFSGIISEGAALSIRGFDFMKCDFPNLFWTLPMLFLLSGLISNIFRRIRMNGFRKFMGSIYNVGKLAKIYATGASKNTSYFILFGCFWATIIGFVIQSPITLFLLSVTLLLSFTLKENSKIILLLSTYLIAININKKNPKDIKVGNIALSILGLSIGFSIYLGLVLVMWFNFDYALLTRIIFTAIFALMFFILRGINNKSVTKKVAKIAIFMFFTLWIAVFCEYIAYADDGGWSESGGNLLEWLANPGSKLIIALGLGASATTGLAWLADTMLGGLASHYNVGELMTLAGLGAAASSPESLANAAFGAALGPFGESLAKTWGGVNAALSGSDGGSGSGNLGGHSRAGGNGGSGGSSGGGGGSSGSGGSGSSGGSGAPGAGASAGGSGSFGGGGGSGSSGSSGGSGGFGSSGGSGGSSSSGSSGGGGSGSSSSSSSGSGGSGSSGSSGGSGGSGGSVGSGASGSSSGSSSGSNASSGNASPGGKTNDSRDSNTRWDDSSEDDITSKNKNQ